MRSQVSSFLSHDPLDVATRVPNLETAVLVCCLLPAVLAFGGQTSRSGWSSEDYHLVFSERVASQQTLDSAIAIGGGGNFSGHRALCYPLIGYGGLWFGPEWCHFGQLMLHLLVVALCFRLLIRIGWSVQASALSMLCFGSMPWIAQPVTDWNTVGTTVSTVLMLVAAHIWISARARRSLIFVCWLSVFLSLTTYELWLAGPLLFWGLEFVDHEKDTASHLSKRMFAATRASLWGLPPFVIYVAMHLALHETSVHRASASVVRMLITFVSVHARVVHWVDQPWGDVFARLGWLFTETPVQAVVTFVVALCVVIALPNVRQAFSSHAKGHLIRELVFAWSVFLAGRLVFLAVGSVSLQVRHNYAGALGVGMMLGSSLSWLLCTQRVQTHVWRLRMMRVAILLGVLVLTAASLNIARGVRIVSGIEREIAQTLLRELPNIEAGSTIVIEKHEGGFPWYDGMMLELLLNDQCPFIERTHTRRAGGVQCFVVKKVDVGRDGGVRCTVNRPTDLVAALVQGSDEFHEILVRPGRGHFYQWDGQWHRLQKVF